MKKLAALLVGAGLMATAGSAWAVPATWTDVMDFDKALTVGTTFSYSHSFLNDNFNPFYDVITSYSLILDLNSNGTTHSDVYVNLPGLDVWPAVNGLTDGGYYNFSVASNVFNDSIFGLIQLNTSGTYLVELIPRKGNVTVDSSTLIATGYDNTPDTAPVPEPGTLVMLGAGLLGLTVYGRRRMQK